MGKQNKQAVAYYRTSSATNVEGDSRERQARAVTAYATATGHTIAAEFYDAAVSGADAIGSRQGFSELVAYCIDSGVNVILCETANRFARDLAVQLTGHSYLKDNGIELIPVDAPDHFTDETPTAVLVRQVLGAISEFDKSATVAKLKAARDRKSAALGRRIEGRKPVPQETIDLAVRCYRKPPGKRRASLRVISTRLAEHGHTTTDGKPYNPNSIRLMLQKAGKYEAA